MRRLESAPKIGKSDSKTKAKPMSPKGRILCTEDDADTRELLTYVLEQHDFDVTCTESTYDALNLAKTQHFDLFVVDNWMPDLSGPELTAKIREFDIKTPILFYSGAGYESDKEAARLAGAQGYLVKPVQEDALIAEVVRLIAESKIAVAVKIVKPKSPGQRRSLITHDRKRRRRSIG